MDPIVDLVSYSCGGATGSELTDVISEVKELQIFKSAVVFLVTYGITKKISIALLSAILWYVHMKTVERDDSYEQDVCVSAPSQDVTTVKL